ncbi:MAG: Proton/sodium-dicarboxylate symporter [Pseudomonadota bacterium]|jgi:Na+/H+-dicarboxylate symporter
MNIRQLATHPVTIIGSVALGVCTGIYAPDFAKSLKFVGDIYVDLLKMVILPFLISAVIVSINRLARNPSASKYVARIVVSLLAGMAIAGAIGVVYMVLMAPGKNLDQSTMQAFGRLVQADVTGVETSINLLSPAASDKQEGMMVKLFVRMIPNNIFNALAMGDTLKTLIFTLLFGFTLTRFPNNVALGFLEGCDAVFRACQKLTTWLLYVLPVASFSLAADQIANTGFEPFKVMAQFIIAFGVVTAILLAACVGVIWRKSGAALTQVAASQEGPFFLAVATRNSASCMPSMLIAMVDRLGFDKDVTELLVPLGTALFRVGPVLYYCMATVFIAQLYGRDLVTTDYVLILIASLIAGFASTGMNGIVTISQTTIVCSLLGLPFEAAFVLFVAVEPICDTFRTVLLVLSINALVALITPRFTSSDLGHEANVAEAS